MDTREATLDGAQLIEYVSLAPARHFEPVRQPPQLIISPAALRGPP
jgi:hypothetical protein